MRAQHDPARRRRGLQAAAVAAAAALGLVVAPATLGGAHATFSATTANAADALAADTLQPPSGLAVAQSCAVAPAITHRPISAGSGTTSLSLAVPSGTTAGDVLVAHVAYRDAPETITAPSGWTRLTEDTGGGQITSDVYWKIATSGETTAVFSRPATSTGPIAGGLIAYVGASVTAPVATWGSATGTGVTATMPALTTPATTVEVLYFLTRNQESLPAPAGTTLLGSGAVGTAPATEGLTAADETVAGPGALPARSSTATSGLSLEWVAQAVVLRRATGIPSADLSWTASSSTWADGYVLARVVGGTTQATATLPGRATTAATDGPLVAGTSYTFRLRTAKGTWRSAPVTAALTTAACP